MPSLELIERKPWAGRRGLPGKLSEALRVWRSLTDADARLYVFRGGGAHLMIGAAFCLLHRRRLVVSASNDLDFIFDRPDRSRWGQALYRAALRRCPSVVVQTTQQLELARRGLGAGARVDLIPSFAELGSTCLDPGAGARGVPVGGASGRVQAAAAIRRVGSSASRGPFLDGRAMDVRHPGRRSSSS